METLPTESDVAATSIYRKELFEGLSGRYRSSSTQAEDDHPLIVALHGGTFSSLYFDVPGVSLFDRANLLGLPILAPDRPGYGESVDLEVGQPALDGNAALLRDALGTAWRDYRGSARGIVLLGHSIGAAIAMKVASMALAWPLLGLVLSGLGLRTPPQSRDTHPAFPEGAKFLMPKQAKDQLMFGPPGSFDARMPLATSIADTTVPQRELIEITTVWQHEILNVAAKIKVPVHYRQAEFDRLWIVDRAEIAGFAASFSGSPLVDAAMMPGIGHCADFHHSSAGLHFQQLGFALQCAALNKIAS
ncbi:alpha/beta hydrolase [Lichenicoccus sp.]|uniref:alpha/beta hydrolase n=1 Tax=Lichenicoccus sp. TaxID=2781899 RepID=UPI003D0F40B8